MKNLYISPKKAALIMSLVVLVLFAAGIFGQYYKFFVGDDPFLLKIVGKLDLDGESNNLPTWYQSSTLLFSSFILGIITLIKRGEKDADFRYWGFLAVVFLYLSIDELVSIHEQATLPLRHAFDLNGYFYLSWVIPGTVAVLIFFFSYLKFLLRLDFQTCFLFILAGSVYVFGAIGVEMLDANYLQMHEAEIHGPKIIEIVAFNYSVMTATEEFFEMTGIVIFIYALLSYLMPAVTQDSVPAFAKRVKTPRTKMNMNESVVVYLQIK